MANHRYQIALQEPGNAESGTTADAAVRHLQFDFDNHDDALTRIAPPAQGDCPVG